MLLVEVLWFVVLFVTNTLLFGIYDVTSASHTVVLIIVSVVFTLTLGIVTWRTWRLWGRYDQHALLLPIVLVDNVLLVAIASTLALVADADAEFETYMQVYLTRWYTGLMLVAGLGYTPVAGTKWPLLLVEFVSVVYVNLVLRNAVFLTWVRTPPKQTERTERKRLLVRPL